MRITIEIPDDPHGRLGDGSLSSVCIDGVVAAGRYVEISETWAAVTRLRDRLWSEGQDHERSIRDGSDGSDRR